jgi:hypothetical protein
MQQQCHKLALALSKTSVARRRRTRSLLSCQQVRGLFSSLFKQHHSTEPPVYPRLPSTFHLGHLELADDFRYVSAARKWVYEDDAVPPPLVILQQCSSCWCQLLCVLSASSLCLMAVAWLQAQICIPTAPGYTHQHRSSRLYQLLCALCCQLSIFVPWHSGDSCPCRETSNRLTC